MLINLVIDKDKNEIAVMPENMKSPASVVASHRGPTNRSKYINNPATLNHLNPVVDPYQAQQTNSRNQNFIGRKKSGTGLTPCQASGITVSKYEVLPPTTYSSKLVESAIKNK